MRKFSLAIGAVLLIGVWHWNSRADDKDTTGYLLLALAWTPSWCALEGTARAAPRCAHGTRSGWLVHGLWPQNDDGTWPEFCDGPPTEPDPAVLDSMMDIMGSAGLAAHQWRKHGTCSGRAPKEYFSDTRKAFEELRFPENMQVREERQVTPESILTVFRQANPHFGADMTILTCREGLLHEIRLCLTQELTPRPCDDRTLARACRAGMISMPPKL